MYQYQDGSGRPVVLVAKPPALFDKTQVALTQITRTVPSTANVALKVPDGIEVYLDEALTQVADSIDFGNLEVDLFGTVASQEPIRVWVQNQSFSSVRLILSDDYANADVVIVGGDPEPILEPDEVLVVDLALQFDTGLNDDATFTVFFTVEGPVPSGVTW